jgi:hypothetical protein
MAAQKRTHTRVGSSAPVVMSMGDRSSLSALRMTRLCSSNFSAMLPSVLEVEASVLEVEASALEVEA